MIITLHLPGEQYNSHQSNDEEYWIITNFLHSIINQPCDYGIFTSGQFIQSFFLIVLTLRFSFQVLKMFLLILVLCTYVLILRLLSSKPKKKWLRIALTIWICEVPAVFDIRTMVEGRESKDIDSIGEDKKPITGLGLSVSLTERDS